MRLDDASTLDQFRKEMQHRVVKYPLNSRPVKEALRFAKQRQDPAFYRIATDKIHAQRQFQREMFGPTRMEQAVEFFTLGSLREVIVTLLLVGSGVLVFDGFKRLFGSAPVDRSIADMDVDQLADKLGIVLESKGALIEPPSEEKPQTPVESSSNKPLRATSTQASSSSAISDEDVSRIAKAIIERMNLQSVPDALTKASADAASREDSPPATGSAQPKEAKPKESPASNETPIAAAVVPTVSAN